MKQRILRHDYFMKIAEFTALRGTCNRLQVGCVLVNPVDHRIASVGYNSSHSGQNHCTDVGCLIYEGHCIRCPHAEIAAITNLEHRYEQLTCYLTHQPCLNCFKSLVSAGVNIIYYKHPYADMARDTLNTELNIKMLGVV